MEKLSAEEIRVLGALMEKEALTPEYYPMTLNGLVNACNQKTSRDPVVEYEESTVESALEMLQARGLISWVHQAGSRVRKFKHNAESRLELDESAEQQALLCVLLLRGPQTLGELRQRTGRMHTFATLEEVESALQSLQTREEPLAQELSKLPGRKERRFGHTLSNQPIPEPTASMMVETGSSSLPAIWQSQLNEREEALRQEIDSLRDELKSLSEAFETFKKEFE